MLRNSSGPKRGTGQTNTTEQFVGAGGGIQKTLCAQEDSSRGTPAIEATGCVGVVVEVATHSGVVGGSEAASLVRARVDDRRAEGRGAREGD